MKIRDLFDLPNAKLTPRDKSLERPRQVLTTVTPDPAVSLPTLTQPWEVLLPGAR